MEKLRERKAPAANHSKESYRFFLKSVPLFAGFSAPALDALLERASVRDHPKDKLLFLTGDAADYFHVILDGWIKLFRETRDGHESVVSVLTRGDLFGRTALLKDGSFPYSAQTVTKSTLLLIPASFMRHMMENPRDFGDFLPKFLEGGLNEMNQQGLEAEHLAQMTSAQRVGCFLLKMCGSQREGSITFTLPYEKSLVAGRLGMTPESFSRSLNQLSAMGVETKHAAVTVHNIAQLQASVCEHCSAMKKECGLSEEC